MFQKGREFLVLRINHLTWDRLWMWTFGGDSNEYAKDVKVNQEGDYIVVGYTRSFGGNSSDDNYWILKIDPLSGETLWTKLYGGYHWDHAFEVAVDKEGYYIMAGRIYSFGAGSWDCWILRLEGIDPLPPEIDGLTQIERDDEPPYGPYSVECKITDLKSGVENAWLKWKKEISNLWDSCSMNNQANNWWQGIIPEQTPPTDSVKIFYFVKTQDSAGNIAYSETLSLKR